MNPIKESRMQNYTISISSASSIKSFLSRGGIKISLPEEIKIKNCNLLGHVKKPVWQQQGTDLLKIPPVIAPCNGRK